MSRVRVREAMYSVLLPVDSSADRAAAQAAAVTNLPHAAEDVEVHVVHVFDDEDVAETTTVEQLPSGKQLVEELRRAGLKVTTESTYGDPTKQIVNSAQEHDADMIVLGGRKRSPMGALIFGSVSQGVILDTDRPVTVTGSAGAQSNT